MWDMCFIKFTVGSLHITTAHNSRRKLQADCSDVVEDRD